MPATVPGHRSPCPAQQPDRNTELLLVMHLGLCKDPNSHLALGLVLGAAGQGEKGNVVREMQLTIWQDLASAALGFELGAHGGFREVWGGAPDLRSVSVYSNKVDACWSPSRGHTSMGHCRNQEGGQRMPF